MMHLSPIDAINQNNFRILNIQDGGQAPF